MNQSLENLAYSQALSSDSLEDRAQEAIAQIPGFPEECPSESKDALVAGYRRRYAEKHTAQVYAVIGGNYVLATDEMLKNKKVEKVSIGVEYAFSFSTHEYAKLTQENPNLRKLVQSIRESTQDYCSNRFNDLKRCAKKLLRKDNGTQRTALSFVESTKASFDAMEKSVKTKASRGDASAKPEKFKLALAAFWTTYNA